MVTRPKETRRLGALHGLALVDTAPEREFDAAAALAARLLDKPFAAISIVDQDRTWFKAKEGMDSVEEVRGPTFCNWTIRQDAVLVVEDAASDPRFSAKAKRDGAYPLRFYAGTPLHAPSGERIGTLCVGAREPARMTEDDVQSLEQLGVMVDALIAARATARDALRIAMLADRQTAELGRQERVLQQAQRMAMIGSWRLPLETDVLELSENAHRICGLEPGCGRLSDVLERCNPSARAEITQAMARTIETGIPYDLEVDLATMDGTPRRVRIIGEVEIDKGRTAALVGVIQDVTERRALEAMLRRSADTDPLTGLANRAAFDRALEAAMARAAEADTPLTLALIDLDDFKEVNDTHGHTAGDDVLRAVGQRLGELWLKGSMAARLGGDEFAVIVEDAELAADPGGVAVRIEEMLRVPVRSDGRRLPARGTVGAALLDPECHTIRDFVHRADTALYGLKRARKGERRQIERRRLAG